MSGGQVREVKPLPLDHGETEMPTRKMLVTVGPDTMPREGPEFIEGKKHS